MQAYFEPEQVFEILIAYKKKKHVVAVIYETIHY